MKDRNPRASFASALKLWSTLRHFLRRFAGNLNRPIFWGGSYIASIFVFAALYQTLNIPLTQSNHAADHANHAAIHQLRTGIQKRLSRTLAQTNEPRIDFEFSIKEVDSSKIMLELHLVAFAHGSDGSFGPRGSMMVPGHLYSVYIEDRIRGYEIYQNTIILENEIGDVYSFDRQYWESLSGGSGDPSVTMLKLFLDRLRTNEQIEVKGSGLGQKRITFSDEELSVLSTHVTRGWDGKVVHDVSAIRLIYFSSVTATTLGYGDIVPVDDTGRLLVSIQTILSMILIGIFLHSLTKERRRPQDAPDLAPPEKS